MSTLNLLPQKPQDSPKLIEVKRKVITITSMALIINLVILSGFAGWWLFLSTKKRITTAQIQKLTAQVTALAPAESLARQIDDRSDKIKEILATRDDSPKIAQDINTAAVEVGIQSWRYTGVDGANSLTVVSEQSDAVETFAEGLASNYQVNLGKLSKDKENIWLGVIKLLRVTL
jgi:hypothetical protein